MNYNEYIDKLRQDENFNNGYGKCKEVCEAMITHFGELEIRKGIFHSFAWGDREHFWCRHKETGQIIDPTAMQHPDGICFPKNDNRYTDMTDMSEEEAIQKGLYPAGKCINCGDYFYNDVGDGLVISSVCSEHCHQEMAGSLYGGF